MKMSKFINSIKVLIFILSIPILTIAVDIDINKAIVDAKKSGKDVVLFLHKDNCGYCEKMVFALEEDDVKQALKKSFILLDINKDDDEMVEYQDFNGTNHQFMKALGVKLYPTMVFINGDEDKFIYNVRGYRCHKKIASILTYISSKSYKKMNLEEYRDELLFNEE